MTPIDVAPAAIGRALSEVLVPQGPVVAWSVLSALVWLLIVVPTVVSILRSRAKLGGLDAALWIILTALFPLIGLVLWLLVGKRRAERVL